MTSLKISSARLTQRQCKAIAETVVLLQSSHEAASFWRHATGAMAAGLKSSGVPDHLLDEAIGRSVRQVAIEVTHIRDAIGGRWGCA
jgi:hypothetical protein